MVLFLISVAVCGYHFFLLYVHTVIHARYITLLKSYLPIKSDRVSRETARTV